MLVDLLKGQEKEENNTCLTGQLLWLKHLVREAPSFDEIMILSLRWCKRRLITDNSNNKVTSVKAHAAVYVRESRGDIKTNEEET